MIDDDTLTKQARVNLLHVLDPDLTDVHDAFTLYQMARVRITRLQAEVAIYRAKFESEQAENVSLRVAIEQHEDDRRRRLANVRLPIPADPSQLPEPYNAYDYESDMGETNIRRDPEPGE
jgi:hypothetical protein